MCYFTKTAYVNNIYYILWGEIHKICGRLKKKKERAGESGRRPRQDVNVNRVGVPASYIWSFSNDSISTQF